MTLSEVADQLYGLPPAEFVGARTAAAAGAKADGDPALATAIKALRKPSTSAWVVNVWVRGEPDRWAELQELGAALRAAQVALDGDELKRLSRQQHLLVNELSAEVQRAAGNRLTDATAREVAATLQAAVADEGATAAVASGRLIRALTAGGFDAVDLDGAVAVPDDLPPTRSRPVLRSVAAPPPERVAPRPRSSAVVKATKAADEARERAALAERALVRSEAAWTSIKDQVDAARERVHEAQRALDQASAELTTLERTRATARRDRDAATRERDAARRVLRKAEAAVQSAAT